MGRSKKAIEQMYAAKADAEAHKKEQDKVFAEWSKGMNKLQVHCATSEKNLRLFIKELYNPKEISNELRNAVLTSGTVKPIAHLIKDGWVKSDDPTGFEEPFKPNPKQSLYTRLMKYFGGLLDGLRK